MASSYPAQATLAEGLVAGLALCARVLKVALRLEVLNRRRGRGRRRRSGAEGDEDEQRAQRDEQRTDERPRACARGTSRGRSSPAPDGRRRACRRSGR